MSWADKAIDDMKASHEAEVANLRADLRAKETEALGYLRAVGTLQERIDKLEKALGGAASLLETLAEDLPEGDVSAVMMSVMAERARAALDQDKGSSDGV